MLHTEPSLSVYADEEEGSISIKNRGFKNEQDNGEFSFAETVGFNGFENLGNLAEENEQIIKPVSGNDESGDVEDDYKMMLDKDPSNPVFLKKYAHHLQSNGDLIAAEEYYFRATQADPEDGEILMQYAKLVWELHHDQDRALGYFEAAVVATPEDSNILAAYARFLWEIDEGEENNETTAPSVEETLEVDEKCCDPLLLRNYAQFLQQTKGDLKGAEEYYWRAVQADPADGEAVSQYAQLVWELHRDKDKACGYFEQAVKAAPADSHVLAAYAKFLWEADDEDGE